MDKENVSPGRWVIFDTKILVSFTHWGTSFSSHTQILDGDADMAE
jgi:hypothetical protein